LQELLRRQHQQEDQDREESEGRMAALHQAVQQRREQLHAEYLHAARARGTELTEMEERRIEGMAAQDASIQVVQERAHTPLVPARAPTPWEAALATLFPAMRVPLADDGDPKEVYDVLGTRDQDALREYLGQVRLGLVRKTSRLSAELARLDGEEFGGRLAESLRQQFADEMKEILAPFQTKPAAAPASPPVTPVAPATPAAKQLAGPDDQAVPWEGDDWDALEPLVRRLLTYMQGRKRADLRDLCPAVWARDYADLSESARETATSKANRFLLKRAYPALCIRFPASPTFAGSSRLPSACPRLAKSFR
jgi:hypothetical protein